MLKKGCKVMKFTVEREQFGKILTTVRLAQGTTSISNNEWVKGVRIETEGKDSLRLSASDATSTISAVVEGINIEKEGSMLIQGDIIDGLSSKMQEENKTSFSVEDNKLDIINGKDKGSYALMDDNFVKIDLVGTENWLTIPIKLFLQASKKVKFAACQDTGTRPKMQAVYFSSADKKVDIVACDGHKMAKLVLTYEEEIADFSVLVRSDIVEKISKALLDLIGDEGNVQICTTNDKMYFRAGHFIAAAVLTDSSYIKYDKIIPSDDKINFVVSCNRKELIRKIDMAGFANKTSKDSNGIYNIGIKVGDEGFGEGFLSIINAKVASNKQSGEISVTQEKGKIPSDFCLWVDYRYTGEVLKNFDCDKIYLSFVDQNSPFVVSDPTQTNYLCLLMPQTTTKK